MKKVFATLMLALVFVGFGQIETEKAFVNTIAEEVGAVQIMCPPELPDTGLWWCYTYSGGLDTAVLAIEEISQAQNFTPRQMWQGVEGGGYMRVFDYVDDNGSSWAVNVGVEPEFDFLLYYFVAQ